MVDSRLIIPEELLEPLTREREESLRKAGGFDPELVIRDEMQEWLSRPERREALVKALLRFTANRNPRRAGGCLTLFAGANDA